MKDRKLFSPFDLIIIVFILVLSLVLVLLTFGNSNNLKAVVRVNGDVIDEFELDQISDEKTLTYGDDIKVDVTFTNDYVFVNSSMCDDKLCEKTGRISRNGQSIVCLPAKVTITLESSEKSDVDVVVGGI